MAQVAAGAEPGSKKGSSATIGMALEKKSAKKSAE